MLLTIAPFGVLYSRGAEKYFRRGSRLNWPEGAVSRESIRAVKKLDRLKVVFPIYLSCSFISLILGSRFHDEYIASGNQCG